MGHRSTRQPTKPTSEGVPSFDVALSRTAFARLYFAPKRYDVAERHLGDVSALSSDADSLSASDRGELAIESGILQLWRSHYRVRLYS